jgi:hypothetical protein
MKRIYLATPYSDDVSEVMDHRYEEVTRKAAEIMNQGYIVFSPITSCHPMAKAFGLPRTWDFWEKFDRAFIEWCDEVWVYKQRGWRESTGVNAEIGLADELGKPVIMVEYTGEW